MSVSAFNERVAISAEYYNTLAIEGFCAQQIQNSIRRRLYELNNHRKN